MVKEAPKPKIWYNGKKYVWDDVAQDYARWFRYGGRRVCRTYRDDQAYDAAVAIAKDIDRRERENLQEIVASSLAFSNERKINPLERRVRSVIWSYPRVGKERFKPAKSIGEAIDYAKNVLNVNAREYFAHKNVDLTMANALNAELWQAKKRFGTCGLVTKIRPLRENDKAYFDPKAWGSHILLKNIVTMEVVGAVICFRISPPKELGVKLSIARWFDAVANGKVSSKDWRHVFRHEIGHSIDEFLRAKDKLYGEKKKQILAHLKAIKKTECGDDKIRFAKLMRGFSTKALEEPEELIAESIAHVLGDGKNKIARQVVAILMEGAPK